MNRTPADIPHTETVANGVTHVKLEPGRLVFCDDCGEDFTDRCDQGGILFQSKALCPKCAPKWERDAREFDEEHLIRGHCPAGMSFADWVRSLR